MDDDSYLGLLLGIGIAIPICFLGWKGCDKLVEDVNKPIPKIINGMECYRGMVAFSEDSSSIKKPFFLEGYVCEAEHKD